MAGVYELKFKGKTILCMDIAGLQSKDKPEFLECVGQAKEIIRKQPPKSLLVITKVTDTGFDSEIASIIRVCTAQHALCKSECRSRHSRMVENYFDCN